MPGERMNIASYIDHTLLKSDATASMLDRHCDEAVEYGFFAVCVMPVWVSRCSARLAGKGVKVCTVAGFPFGTSESVVKAFEARRAIEQGADEIDMVINIGALKDGQLDVVEHDIRCVVEECKPGRLCKVIIETCLLTNDEKTAACRAAMKAGADFVKTSTGLAGGGATVEDIVLMRKTVGVHAGVKAAGGIKTYETARAMIDAGANRIGTSSGLAIVAGVSI